MRKNQKEVGGASEQKARAFLEHKGYRVLEQNYRIRGGEIDLICLKEGVLSFVEVKARSTTDFGNPQDFVDEKKKKRIEKTANHYLTTKRPDYETLRFDVVEIYLEDDIIHFIPDAFQAEVSVDGV